VRNAAGELLGAVVEWRELTLELNVENEVDGIVGRALDGDFTGRIELAGKSGFMLKLSESMNGLLELTSDSVHDVARVLQALAQGDLTQRITRNYRGVLENLKNDANQTSDKLAEIVNNIADSAVQVNLAALEIAESGSDLSKRSEQQASSLEETAAAMEQMTATVKLNSGNAQQAKDLAISATASADEGGHVAADAVAAMGRIQGSSQRISDIVGVIDEIAFQTNLLALNAAVEAARAGEAGKGFAVVAQEVRSLAQRCGEASKEIKGLISESSVEVTTGVGLVNQAGSTLTEIVSSIRKVAAIVTEIASASTEQSEGLDEITSSMSQMDEMTQQNAAMTEQSTAAAISLQEQASKLKGLVAFFRTSAGQRVAAPVAAPIVGGGKVVPLKPRAPQPVTSSRPGPEPKIVSRATTEADWEEF
jgi:methyl-accepting chemotaxis protein